MSVFFRELESLYFHHGIGLLDDVCRRNNLMSAGQFLTSSHWTIGQFKSYCWARLLRCLSEGDTASLGEKGKLLRNY